MRCVGSVQKGQVIDHSGQQDGSLARPRVSLHYLAVKFHRYENDGMERHIAAWSKLLTRLRFHLGSKVELNRAITPFRFVTSTLT